MPQADRPTDEPSGFTREVAPRPALPKSFACVSVLQPVPSGISKWVCRHTSQSCCPWNVRFSQALKEPAFAAREVLAGKDARTLAREILAMNDEDFRTAFLGSPMKRAKLRGLRRNAAVVLGNVGSLDDVDVLTPALDESEPPLRRHAAWAISRLTTAGDDPAVI